MIPLDFVAEQMLAGDGPRTRDLGGSATTADVTAEVVASFAR